MKPEGVHVLARITNHMVDAIDLTQTSDFDDLSREELYNLHNLQQALGRAQDWSEYMFKRAGGEKQDGIDPHDLVIASREKKGHIRIERNLWLVTQQDDAIGSRYEIQMGDVRVGEVHFHPEVELEGKHHYSLHFLLSGGNYCGCGEADISTVSGRCKLAAEILRTLAEDNDSEAKEHQDYEAAGAN